jgi:hypothetical protein
MKGHTRLLSGAVLFHIVWAAGLLGLSMATVYAQHPLPEFALPSPLTGALPSTIDQLKVKNWVRGPHPSMIGKSGAQLALQSATASTIPLWTGNDSGYQFMMVGLDPTVPQANPVSTIKAQLIPVKFTFYGTEVVVFDPEKKDICTPSAALTMVQNSPIFKNISLGVGGTPLGTAQFTSLFQRANFFKYTGPSGINPKYEVTLTQSTLRELNVTVPGMTVLHGGCYPLGLIEINTWDKLLTNQILPQLGSQGVRPTTFPIFLFYNVAMYDTAPSNGLIFGYHNSFINWTNGALQTYAVVDYDTTTANCSIPPHIPPPCTPLFADLRVKGVQDIAVMSHEIAEWMDDPALIRTPPGNPTTGNPTPPWGGVGQVPVGSCQSNLEVGDPLTGTVYAIPMPNFTYHVQDLAFKSWFYHDRPSVGVNGWYSLFGTFTTPAASCPPPA